MSLVLHPVSASPDPLYGRAGTGSDPFLSSLVLHPVEALRAAPASPAFTAWKAGLDRFRQAVPLTLKPDSGRVDLLLDFGTELEGELELEVRGGPFRLYASFGESVAEAETWGVPTTHPHQTVEWVVDSGGTRRRFAGRGFRFLRLQVHEAARPVEFRRIAVRATFGFRSQPGDFRCSDERFQRVWQTSAYTVRLCARATGYWDGIKRDRHGWFGDARVMQAAADAVFFDPRPAAGMLAGQLATDAWTMGIPGYSFDAAAMLHEQALAFGAGAPGVRDGYRAVRAMLEWAARTQCDGRGLIKQDPKQSYFSTVCFFDWSVMPVGGRFEDLSPLQCQHLEALRLAARVARWLGKADDAARWTRRADRLERTVLSLFWNQRAGLRHTLRQTSRHWLPMFNAILDPARVFLTEYHRAADRGPSGASRHSLALAWRAGLLDDPARRRTALRLLASPRLPEPQTPYFHYYAQDARAGCGDPAGALRIMRDYVGGQLEANDSATVWEWHVPGEGPLARLALGDWPKSLCHGWGAGLIPLALRHLLGLRPLAPGWAAAGFVPDSDFSGELEASVPTPFGPIRVSKARRGRWECRAPRGIELRRGGAAAGEERA